MISLKTNDWNIYNIETILFDKDGTFIDLHYFWGKMTELRCHKIIQVFKANEELFSELCLCLGYNLQTQKMIPDGITAMYSRQKIIEIFKNDLINYNIKTTTQQLEEIFDEVSLEFYKKLTEYTKPINEAIEFIKKIRQKNIKTAVVTSDSIVSTELTLKHFGWEVLFDYAVGRENSTETKESGALTKIALTKLNANPKTTIMIGDAPMDFISAKNAGIEKTILVETGQINKSTLLKISPYVVETLAEMDIC